MRVKDVKLEASFIAISRASKNIQKLLVLLILLEGDVACRHDTHIDHLGRSSISLESLSDTKPEEASCVAGSPALWISG